MKSPKNKIWESEFSDNFKPNFFEKIIKSIEVPRALVISRLLPKKAGSVLDIACGDGNTLISLSNRFNKLVGVDIAGNRIKNAKASAEKNGIKNVDFINTDIDKGLPFKTSTFDYVICEASISYFYQLSTVLSEVKRVLKTSGEFIVETPNYAFITRRIALLFGKMPKTSSFPGQEDGGALHYFTHGSLKEILKKHGFNVTKKLNSGVFPEVRKIYPELLSGDIIYLCKKIK